MDNFNVGDELAIRLWDQSYNVGQVRDIKPVGECYSDGAKGDRVVIVKVMRVGRLGLAIMDEAPEAPEADGGDDA